MLSLASGHLDWQVVSGNQIESGAGSLTARVLEKLSAWMSLICTFSDLHENRVIGRSRQSEKGVRSCYVSLVRLGSEPMARPLRIARNDAIIKSYASGGYSMKEIADFYELHYSWISRLVSEAVKAKNKT